MTTTTTLTLTSAQLDLLRAVLNSADDARSSLSVAEQTGTAYDDDGEFNEETVVKTELTFDSLLAVVRSA